MEISLEQKIFIELITIKIESLLRSIEQQKKDIEKMEFLLNNYKQQLKDYGKSI